MAINKPIIAGKPVVRRNAITTQPVETRSAPPGSAEQVVDDQGVASYNPPVVPSTEGQLIFYTLIDQGVRGAEMYVAVDIGGTLEWKRTAVYKVINGYTGKPVDPIYD